MPKKKRIADKNERLPSPMFDMGTMPYIETVSYTHLDVYKRQVIQFIFLGL